jgi:hypothetical protein
MRSGRHYDSQKSRRCWQDSLEYVHTSIHDFMPARVQYRLGSIFDEECDLLVVPSSAQGTVSPQIEKEIRKAGLMFPMALPWGTININASPNPQYKKIAFAAAVRRQKSSPPIVEKIGYELGIEARQRPIRISAPLLGAGVRAGLSPSLSVTALKRGFLSGQPNENSRLTINVQSLEILAGLIVEHPLLVRGIPKAENPVQARPDSIEPAVPLRAVKPNTTPSIAPPVSNTNRTRVFISYSHADADWLDRLRKHLRPLERGGAMIWADTRIKAGAQWREEIRAALAETKVAVLLISADFMASEFIVTNELPPLLRAAEDEGATILPVIISASSFLRTPSLARFQAVNNPDKPLVQLRKANREKVLDDVARAVEDALRQ